MVLNIYQFQFLIGSILIGITKIKVNKIKNCKGFQHQKKLRISTKTTKARRKVKPEVWACASHTRLGVNQLVPCARFPFSPLILPFHKRRFFLHTFSPICTPLSQNKYGKKAKRTLQYSLYKMKSLKIIPTLMLINPHMFM